MGNPAKGDEHKSLTRRVRCGGLLLLASPRSGLGGTKGNTRSLFLPFLGPRLGQVRGGEEQEEEEEMGRA